MCIFLPLGGWWRWKKMRELEKWVAIQCITAVWVYCPRSLVQRAPTKVHSSFDRHCYVNTRQARLTSGVRIHTFFPTHHCGLWNGSRKWVHLNFILSLHFALFSLATTSWAGLIILRSPATIRWPTLPAGFRSNSQTVKLWSSTASGFNLPFKHICLTRAKTADFIHFIMVEGSECPLWPQEPCCRGQFAPGSSGSSKKISCRWKARQSQRPRQGIKSRISGCCLEGDVLACSP